MFEYWIWRMSILTDSIDVKGMIELIKQDADKGFDDFLQA
jgi:hypothetical protein